MTINTDVQSTSGNVPEQIKERVEDAAGQIKEKARGAAHEVAGRVREMKRFTPNKNVIRSSLLVSGAALGSAILASALRGRNPLETLSTMGDEMQLIGRRRRRTIQPSSIFKAIASTIGCAMLISAVNHRIGRRVSDRPIMRGALAMLSAIGIDSLLMGPSYVGRVVKTLGPGGAALKYGAVGGAYSFGSRGGEETGEPEYGTYRFEGESTGREPFYSGSEVGTVAGSPEHPQPLV